VIDFNKMFQSGDWKAEKHIPAIEILEKGEKVKIRVSVGKEIPHPNTTEHHIEWIEIYFMQEGAKFPYLLGRFTFNAHGASTEGPNTSGVFTEPDITFSFKVKGNGTLIANSYCNIHGLWKSEEELKI